MIESVETFNFQKHKRRLIEFDPGVNVLVGRNEAGKSTTVRAIRWVVFNRPLGEKVIRWGQTRAKVRLKARGHLAVREKTEGTNNYRLDGGTPFDAIGTGIPRAVTEALALDEINFQRQIDAPFWLSNSGPEVAREMNRVVDLEVIDRAMAFAASKVRAGTAEVKVLTGIQTDAQARVAALKWVPALEAMIRDADSRSQALDTATSRIERLSRLIGDLREAQRGVPEIPDLQKADQIVSRLKVVNSTVQRLELLTTRLKEEQEELCRLERLATQATKALTRMTPRLCKTCGQPLKSGPS